MSASGHRERIDFVDGLRGLAALYVTVHHVLFNFWPPWGRQPSSGLLEAAFKSLWFGRYAVAVFIVLSGFCLALPVAAAGGRLRGSFFDFVKRRARRILPPYYAALLLSIVYIAITGTEKSATLWDESVHMTAWGFVAHALVLQNFFGPHAFGQFNYVLWSVAVEWHIYFLFPLVVLGFVRLPKAVFAASLLTLASLAGWLLRDTHWAYANVQFVGLFGLGVWAAFLSPKSEYVSRLRVASGLLGAVFLAVLVGVSAAREWGAAAATWPVTDAITGLATAFGLIYLRASPRSVVRRVLEAKIVAGLGVFSYSLYLVHAPVLHAVWLLTKKLGFGYNAGFVFAATAGVGLCLVVAKLFHLAFERPFMKTSASAKAGPATVASERSLDPVRLS